MEKLEGRTREDRPGLFTAADADKDGSISLKNFAGQRRAYLLRRTAVPR